MNPLEIGSGPTSSEWKDHENLLEPNWSSMVQLPKQGREAQPAVRRLTEEAGEEAVAVV